MTFDEAKKLKEYNFKLNGIERLIDDIRNNYMKDMYEDGERYIGVAVLEIGYIDIEVNIMTEEQVSRKPHPGDKTPVIDYFICLKMMNGNRKDTWITTSRLTGMQMTGRNS